MHNDDVYINSSAYYPTSKQAEEATDKELTETFEQFPLLEEVVGYCNQQIELLSSIDSIQVDITKDADSHRIQVLTNQRVKAGLMDIKTWLESRMEAARKK